MNDKTTLPPVTISSRAYSEMIKHMRRWSGWDDARLVFGTPDEQVSPYAHTQRSDHSFVVNADVLLLNPNRVLRTVNPFRLRQEAVLTGTMLHEAGHARHSDWLPCSPEQAKIRPALHSDGTAPSKATVDLAITMEEARIEGLMYRDQSAVGAAGLGWTMRATAAALLPPTHLDGSAEQQLMDLIGSWAKRAGRQIAIAHWVDANPNPAVASYQMPQWVGEFTALLTSTVADHLMGVTPDPEDEECKCLDFDCEHTQSKANLVTMSTQVVLNTLRNMVRCEDDTGPTMLDMARDVLTVLFPETPPEDMPSPSETGCGSAGEGDDEAESGEGEAESGDESAEQGDGGAEAHGEGDEAGDGTGEGQGEASEGEGSGSGEAEASADGSEGGSGTEGQADERAEKMMEALAKVLAEIEDEADEQTKAEAKAETKAVPEVPDADPNIRGAGKGDGRGFDAGWRVPKADEWATSRNASRFLADLIDPTETSKVSLTDSPSALVDGAALAAWRASGQSRDPRFFVRTRREITPAPPVKIAVLVDVSESMGVLQKPSALLSWALANAVSDLRNFAGGGQKVESCLIHWGSTARVIQKNGEPLPGMREVVCREGTWALGDALALVETEMPGFFDPSEKPENRLLVQFTDWDLSWGAESDSLPWLTRSFEAGVNMLTIGPSGYARRSNLPGIMRQIPIQRGRNVEVVYNKMFPEAVWDEAAKVLRS